MLVVVKLHHFCIPGHCVHPGGTVAAFSAGWDLGAGGCAPSSWATFPAQHWGSQEVWVWRFYLKVWTKRFLSYITLFRYDWSIIFIMCVRYRHNVYTTLVQLNLAYFWGLKAHLRLFQGDFHLFHYMCVIPSGKQGNFLQADSAHREACRGEGGDAMQQSVADSQRDDVSGWGIWWWKGIIVITNVDQIAICKHWKDENDTYVCCKNMWGMSNVCQ